MSSNSALISVRVPATVAQRLQNLARAVARSKSYLAAEAIEDYLDIHEWQVQGIQQGLEEIEQGNLVDYL